MNYNTLTLNSPLYPDRLRQISSPPKQLSYDGNVGELLKRPTVAIVGTRRITPYGKQITHTLASKLAEQGVVIISGLAYGVDAAAHRGALDVQGLTIAVLPGPLDDIMPVGNQHLAQRILDQGGALVSEYGPKTQAFKQNFVARNRIVSGLADAILITEAWEGSGARHTADFALDQGKHLMAVPGDITKPSSMYTNLLLKSGHAAPITSYTDVLDVLGLTAHTTAAHIVKGSNPQEQSLLDLLLQGVSEGDELYRRSQLDIRIFNQTLTRLEIAAKIRPLGANHWGIT